MVDFLHMDKYRYEQMCESLLAEEYGATPIRVSVGDGGIDSFAGALSEKVKHVWQFKHFPDGLGDSQKQQIRESLATVVKNYKPQDWTLVVPLNTTQAERKWFEKLKADYAKKGVRLHFIGETELRNLLVRHRALKQFYFPDTEGQLKVFSGMLGGENALFEKPKASALDLNKTIGDYINKDSNDFGFRATTDETGQTIEAFLRRPDAKDPTALKGAFKFPDNPSGRAARKQYQDLFRKGTPLVLGPENFEIQWSVFDELVGKDWRFSKVEIRSAPPEMRLPLKFVVTTPDGGSEAINYLDMRRVRLGTEEVEFSNEGQGGLFTVSIVFGGESSTFTITLNGIVGARPSDLVKADRLFAALSTDGARAELHSIELDKMFASSKVGIATGEPFEEERVAFHRDLAVIEERLDPSIRMRESYTDTDMATAEWLAEVLKGDSKTKTGVATAIMTVNNPDALRESAAVNAPIAYETTAEERVTLLGKTYVLEADVTINTAPRYEGDLASVQAGDEVPVTFEGDAVFVYKGGRRL